MVDLTVNLAGLEMDNPVVPASGTFGFGKEFKDIYDINILGSFSFKGTTKDARFGNPTPRIAECTSGMINAVGLQNPGVHHVIEHELPEMKEYFHKPVIANVSGFSVDDYAYTFKYTFFYIFSIYAYYIMQFSKYKIESLLRFRVV